MIESQGKRLTVKVAARYHRVSVGQYGGIVDRGLELRRQRGPDVSHGVPVCAVHLWDTTKRIGVLNQMLGFPMRPDYRAVFQQPPNAAGDLLSAHMLPQRHDIFCEDDVR